MYVSVWAYACRYTCTMCRGRRITSGVFLGCSPPYLLWDKISLHSELTHPSDHRNPPFSASHVLDVESRCSAGEDALLTWVWPGQGGQCLKLEGMERPYSGQGMNVQERLTICWESKCKKLPLQLRPLQDDTAPCRIPTNIRWPFIRGYNTVYPSYWCISTWAYGSLNPDLCSWYLSLRSSLPVRFPGPSYTGLSNWDYKQTWWHSAFYVGAWIQIWIPMTVCHPSLWLEFFKIMIFVSNLWRVVNHIRRRALIQGFTIALIFKMSLNKIP